MVPLIYYKAKFSSSSLFLLLRVIFFVSKISLLYRKYNVHNRKPQSTKMVKFTQVNYSNSNNKKNEICILKK